MGTYVICGQLVLLSKCLYIAKKKTTKNKISMEKLPIN